MHEFLVIGSRDQVSRAVIARVCVCFWTAMAVAWSKLKKESTVQERVDLVAEKINNLCWQLLSGEDVGGMECFQKMLLDIIHKAGLSEKDVLIDVSLVGVHPDNREGSGLVAADVQQLLSIMVQAGYVRNKTKLLVCEIPGGKLGEFWRSFNDKIAEQSDGFLPPSRSSFMKYVTVQGSHTTGAIRCVKFGARSAHKTLGDGCISSSKIIESRPSFDEPVNQGMYFVVIKKELIEACPHLMYCLSRSGNASHGAEREHTCLQQALAVFRAEKVTNNWADSVKVASAGQCYKFEGSWEHIKEFVIEHAGGGDGKYLYEMERFERTLGNKRAIQGSTLGKLAGVKLHGKHAARYVPAMVKAMLMAPESKIVGGYVDLFSSMDLSSLQGQKGKNVTLALQACDIMIEASNFINAYAQDPSLFERDKDELEVNLVMRVHQIHAPERMKFRSLIHVAEYFYDTIKSKDSQFPQWSVVAELQNKSSSSRSAFPEKRKIRELTEDGTMPDVELFNQGFKMQTKVKRNNDKRVFLITDLSNTSTATLTEFQDPEDLNAAAKPKAKGKGGKKAKKAEEPEPLKITVSRFALIEQFNLVKEVQEKIYDLSEMKSPIEHLEFNTTIWKGLVKDEMKRLYLKSKERDNIKLIKPVKGSVQVICKYAFKVDKLALYAISNNVTVSQDKENHSLELGKVDIESHGSEFVCIKPNTVFPPDEDNDDIKDARGDTQREIFLSSFWIVRRIEEIAKCNVKISTQEVTIKGVKMNFPLLVNTREIQANDELLIYKHEAPEMEETDTAKRSKGAKGKGRGNR